MNGTPDDQKHEEKSDSGSILAWCRKNKDITLLTALLGFVLAGTLWAGDMRYVLKTAFADAMSANTEAHTNILLEIRDRLGRIETKLDKPTVQPACECSQETP